MNALTLLYRLRIKVLPRYLTEEDSRRRWQYGSLAVVGVIVFIFVLSFGVGFFGALGADPSLAAAALSAVFNLTVIICILTGLASALYTLYLSDDLEVLTATPVRERTILGYKFAETLLTNSPVFVLAALPICIAYAAVVAESAAATVAVLAVLIAVSPLLLAVPTALCIMFSMPLMRVLPASRAKEIVAGLGALAGAGLYVGYLTLIGGPESGQGPEDSRGAVSAVAPLLESPASQIPPGSWAAGALSAAVSGGTGVLGLNLALLAALAAASYLLCVAIAGFSYSTGRARAAESGSRTGSSNFAGGLSGRLLAPLPAGVRAVALKEVRTLRRDLRRLASVMAPVIILLGAFFINSGGFSEEGGPWYAYLIPYAPAVLAGGMLSLVLTSYSVGTEGSSYWYLAASPLTPARVLAGKLAASVLYGAGGSLIVCVLVSLFTGAASVAGFIAGTAGGTVAGAVLGLYGVGISAMYARFDADNPNQALTQAGGFVLALMFFGLMATAGIAVAIGFGLAQVIPVWLAIAIAALVWTGGCAVGGYAVAAAGAASLSRIDL